MFAECPICGSPPKPLTSFYPNDIPTCLLSGHTLEPRPLIIEVEQPPKKSRKDHIPEEEKRKVWKKLRGLLAKQKGSNTHVARDLGISESWLSEAKRGRLDRMSMYMMQKVIGIIEDRSGEG